MNGLTEKMSRYALNLFEGMSQRDAYVKAGYSSESSPITIDAHSCRLANADKILARLEELRLKAEDASIATVVERKQKLTEIMRGNLLDYQELGADGGYLNIDRDKPNTGAIKEITSRTEYDKDGANAALVTTVKLHSPIQAIAELNKMEKIYETGGNVFVDARSINIGADNDPKGALISFLAGYATRIGEDAVDRQPDSGTAEDDSE